MIPDVYLTQWQRLVRWPTMRQVEQDLILAALLIEISNDPLLGKDWASGVGRPSTSSCYRNRSGTRKTSTTAVNPSVRSAST